MSWTKLAPIAKTTGRPMASASIVVNKDGVPKIHLILSASLKDEFGDPKRADVSAGDGANEGKLLIEFISNGAFEVGNFVHGGGRITLPVPAGMPDKPAANAPCTVTDKVVAASGQVVADDFVPSLVVTLPTPVWRRDIAERIKPPVGGSSVMPPRPRGPSAPPPPEPEPAAGSVVDVVEYLGRKGLKVSRLAGGRFMLSGQTVMLAEVLGQVNKIRAEAGLPALTSAQVK